MKRSILSTEKDNYWNTLFGKGNNPSSQIPYWQKQLNDTTLEQGITWKHCIVLKWFVLLLLRIEAWPTDMTSLSNSPHTSKDSVFLNTSDSIIDLRVNWHSIPTSQFVGLLSNHWLHHGVETNQPTCKIKWVLQWGQLAGNLIIKLTRDEKRATARVGPR